MVLDIQKASVYKRISAFLFDVIMLSIVTVGCALLMSVIVRYSAHYEAYREAYDEAYARYEAEYGVTFDISEETYDAFTEEERANYDAASQAFSYDEEVSRGYALIFNLTFIVVTFGLLLGHMIMEFVVPMLLKNGQTLGKKMFGIGLIQSNGVRLRPMALFARTLLGKFTIEAMIPTSILIMILFTNLGLTGTILLLVLFAVQIVTMIVTKNRSCIHDLLAGTVAVDFASQMVFDSEEELIAYKKRIHAERAERAEYK